MRMPSTFVALCLMCSTAAFAQSPAGSQPAKPAASYDAALAKSVGADENGMRNYVFVLLKTSPTPVPKGPERDAMFAGHFANIERLAAAGKLAIAGPMDGVDGWRGMFIFAVADIEEAKKLVATDPVIVKGEMIAEYHQLFASAALMRINDLHKSIINPSAR
jgi:uncharacterized protein YciI